MADELERLTGEDATREMLFKAESKEGVKGVFVSDLARLRFGVFGCIMNTATLFKILDISTLSYIT
jgi:hypothetical protein